MISGIAANQLGGSRMDLHTKFCTEQTDAAGVLTAFSLKVPADYNFGYDVVDVLGRETPDAPALVWCNPAKEERRFSFAEIARLSNQTANVLRALGVRKGDRVLVLLRRNYEYWYVAPALHKLGAVLIPATHMLTVDDLRYRVQTADVKLAIASPEGSTVTDLLQVEGIQTVCTFRRDEPGAVNLTPLVERTSPTLARVPTRADEPMLIYFTSGTTGYPKAVMHDHTYSLSHILTAKHWQHVRDGGLHLTVAETGWGKASWGKIYGQWLCGCAVMVYDFEAFSPGSLLSVMERYRVTSFCAPPTVYRYFVRHGMEKYNLSALHDLTTAGEAMNPEVFRRVQEQTGLEVREGFGQTESVLMLANLDRAHPGSLGRPTPLYYVEILKEDGSFAADGEVGELVVVPRGRRQYGIFMGYCGNEELYASVWRGGVYHTGDTAWRDKDGLFWYVGRVDDLIKTRGFRVGPFEVENVLIKHEAVLECAVVGQPDENRGQIIVAYVLPAAGYEPTPALARQLRKFANAQLAAYKWISRVEFVESLPKTISGKIRYKELRIPAVV